MSVSTPSTQQLSDNIIAQIAANISQSVPALPKAFIAVLAKVLAATIVILWKYCGFIALQLFVAYATDDSTTINGKVIRPLREWGRLIGVGDPLPSVQAQHDITVTVNVQTGSLAAGTALLFPDTNIIYETTAVAALNAASISVTVRAVSDQNGGDGSGSIGNLQNGAVLEFANPPPNVAGKATVTGQKVAGTDAESVDAYRARILARFQAKPQGGAYADYRAWAEDVNGIVGVYPYAGEPGEVDIYCEATIDSSGSPDGIPTQAQLDAVGDAIEEDEGGLASRRPVGAAKNVLPIVRTAFDVNVIALDVDDVTDTKDKIATGVDQHLRSLEPYIEGLSALPRKDRITQANVAAVVAGIVAAAGGTVAGAQLIENGSVITARSLAPGEKSKLGTPLYS